MTEHLPNVKIKGIVHPKMKIGCVSAYSKGIQDVESESESESERALLPSVFTDVQYRGVLCVVQVGYGLGEKTVLVSGCFGAQ